MDYGLVFNTLTAPIVSIVIGLLKKWFPKTPLLHNWGTLLTVGVAGAVFTWLMSFIGIVHITDQVTFLDFMKGLGVSTTLAVFGWEAGLKKLFKPKTVN